MTDEELIRQFADRGDHDAFAQIVRRHIHWVYSLSLRLAQGNHATAEDISQAVFILLSQKAGSLRGRRHSTLSQWLFAAARFCHLGFVRRELRHRQRQQKIAIARREIGHLDDPLEVSWADLAPVLDELVAKLGRADRQAILLRFYEGRQFAEIGRALGISEDAARKRIGRALRQLREMFARRGFTMGVATLGTVVAANLSHPAPAAVVVAATQAVTLTSGAYAPTASSMDLARRAAAIMRRAMLAPLAAAVLLVLMVITAVQFPKWPLRWAASSSDLTAATGPAGVSIAGNAPSSQPLVNRGRLISRSLGISLNSGFRLTSPGSAIHLDYRGQLFAVPLSVKRVMFTFQNQYAFSLLHVRLTDGTELTVKPRNPTQGQFAWYDPAIHTASEFSCPSAPIPPALVNELRDGWLDANVWVDGAATGPGSASIGVSVEAYVSDQVTAPDR